tara:strand:+ start:22 stop:201 length:180 start_codon:yes stop_codon:yes gene_type:complete
MSTRDKFVINLIFFGCVLAFFVAERIDNQMPPTEEEVLLQLQIEVKKLQIQKLQNELNQ